MAQDPAAAGEPPSREDLLARAAAARDAGDHEGALSLAGRAGALAMTPSLRLFIAQQQALTGRLPDAVRSAERCVAEATADPALNQREAILETCREIVRRIGRRVARITVRVAHAPADTRVELNGVRLAAEELGRSLPVFVGDVRIVARAAGAVVEQRVALDAGDETSVELSFAAPAAAAPDPPEPTSAASAAAPDPAWLAIPIGLAVAAGAASAVTGALVLERGADYDAAAMACRAGDALACNGASGARDDAEGLALATNVLWVGAAIAAIAAAITALFVDAGEGRALVSRAGVGARF